MVLLLGLLLNGEIASRSSTIVWSVKKVLKFTSVLKIVPIPVLVLLGVCARQLYALGDWMIKMPLLSKISCYICLCCPLYVQSYRERLGEGRGRTEEEKEGRDQPLLPRWWDRAQDSPRRRDPLFELWLASPHKPVDHLLVAFTKPLSYELCSELTDL